MRSYVRVGISFLVSYGAGLVGALFVTTGVGSWYAALEKPWFYPPQWTFAPVWIALYACIAIALAIVWNKDPYADEMRGWVPLFFGHLLLNAAWTVFFFGFHAILVALIDIIILLVCVILLFCGALEVDRRAAYLLAPYLAWVCFAAALNASIWYLN